MLTGLALSGCTGIRIGPPPPPPLQAPKIIQERVDILVLERKVHELWEAEKFAELEAMAKELRASRTLFPCGMPRLEAYYAGLNWQQKKPSDWKTVFERQKRWSRAFPQSATPLIVSGQNWTTYAWAARGNGWASSVTDAQWEQFYERLNEAEKLLRRAQATEPSDPTSAVALMGVGLGKSWERKQMDEQVARGLKAFPRSAAVYRAPASSLLPRWGAEPGELQAYASRYEPEVLALVFSAVMRVTDVKEELDIPWGDLKKSFEALLRTYPSELNMNRYAYAAYLYRDRSKLKGLTEQLGDHYDPALWDDGHFYNKCRAWARDGQN